MVHPQHREEHGNLSRLGIAGVGHGGGADERRDADRREVDLVPLRGGKVGNRVGRQPETAKIVEVANGAAEFKYIGPRAARKRIQIAAADRFIAAAAGYGIGALIAKKARWWRRRR